VADLQNFGLECFGTKRLADKAQLTRASFRLDNFVYRWIGSHHVDVPVLVPLMATRSRPRVPSGISRNGTYEFCADVLPASPDHLICAVLSVFIAVEEQHEFIDNIDSIDV